MPKPDLAGGEVVLEHGTFSAKDAPAVPARKVRVDRATRDQGAVRWEWAPFTNSARDDGLVLHHWQKRGVEFAEYPYARFNVQLERVTYTDEEYGGRGANQSGRSRLRRGCSVRTSRGRGQARGDESRRRRGRGQARGDESRRGRGRAADKPVERRVAATPRPQRG